MTAATHRAGLWINQALEAFKARDRDTCASLIVQTVRSNAPLDQGWAAVSRLASVIGEVDAALVAARRFASLDSGQPGPWLALGQMLAHHGRLAEAEEVGVHLIQKHRCNPAAWHFLGTCRAQMGHAEQSMADLRQAVALASPGASAASWHAIAEGKTFQAYDPDFETLIALAAAIPTRKDMGEARSTVFYALGKAFDDIGESDKAFAAYVQAAATLKPHRPYDADATDRFVEAVVSAWTADFHARLPNGLEDDGRPIFVLGLPRSGTTLVEQILVSHELVRDGAEVNLFSVAAMPVRGFTPQVVGTFVEAKGEAGLTKIGRAYRRLLDQRFGPDGRVVDKTLNHSRYLGLIAKVLPHARFIWLRRSPGAVAWSCWRTRFAGGVDWSLSLPDIGRYFIGEDRLHAHWSSLLGDRILTVPYEELVIEPEPWIDRILDHARLPRRPNLKDFHLTNRAITTASYAQVRRPLYTTSREAWRRYQSHLQPVFDAYGQAPH